jgi:hypothetical protein
VYVCSIYTATIPNYIIGPLTECQCILNAQKNKLEHYVLRTRMYNAGKIIVRVIKKTL